jgi:3-hydroxyisobutyrate dehydrogenase
MAGQEPVAVLGAGGLMGLPMTRRLAQAGFEVHAWNRSPDKLEPLAREGVRIAASPADAARGAGLVLTILSDTDAVVDAMDGGSDGALSVMPNTAIWLQMSTIGVAGTERCGQLAAGSGVSFVDAPVLGSRQPAEEGKLSVLASGPAQLRPRLDPVFDVLGGKTMWVGEAGAGSRLKLVANNWVLTVVEGGAETIALAQGLGLDPALLFEALAGGALDVPYLRLKGKAMIEGDFTPAFRLRLAAKDAGLVTAAAEGCGLDLPLPRTIWQRMSEGAREHGDEDFSATYLTSAPKQSG